MSNMQFTAWSRRTVVAFFTVWVISIFPIASAGAGDMSPEQLEKAGLDTMPVEQPAPDAAGRAPAALVEASVVLEDGDIPAGMTGPVATINNPFTNGAGEVGFSGNADENFIWHGSGVVWKSSDAAGYTLSGAEFSCGIGDSGAFVYSPSIDSADGVWSHNGFLAVEETPAPGLPTGTLTTFHSRPSMIPSGQAYWIAGYGDSSGGTTSIGRVLYSSSDSTPANIVVNLQDLTTIGPYTIAAQGISFDYDFSDDGQHDILQLKIAGAPTGDDDFVAVDRVPVAREAEDTGDSDLWGNFDYVSINNSGDYFFTGDTDGATTTDEFIAYNGSIVLREGDTVDGQLLGASASLRGAALNNLGHAIYIWSFDPGSGTVESLFFACDASDLLATSTLILSTGDELDLDGDGNGDALVTDFNASLGQITFPDSDQAYVELDISYDGGSTELEAVVSLTMPACGTGNVFGHVDHTPVVNDATTTTVEAWETTGGTLVSSTAVEGNGDWALDLPADSYDVLVARPNFLWGTYPITVADTGNVVLPDLTLVGGDFDGSGDVAVVDVTYVASRYGGSDLSADLNGSGAVDLVDVTATASAYGSTAPVPWS